MVWTKQFSQRAIRGKASNRPLGTKARKLAPATGGIKKPHRYPLERTVAPRKIRKYQKSAKVEHLHTHLYMCWFNAYACK